MSIFPITGSGQHHNEWIVFYHKGKSVQVEPYPFTENLFQVPIRGKMFDFQASPPKYFTESFIPVKKFLQPLWLN